MIYARKNLILGFVLCSILGTGLHFLHDLIPNSLTALVAPVNESIWEHVKIILYPYLIGGAVLTWGRPTAMRPWLLTAILLVVVMLGFGYWYHVLLGRGNMWVDIGLYFVLMAVGFWLPTRFSGPFQTKIWWLPGIFVGLLVIMVTVYSFYPPNGILFQELKTRESWHGMLFPYPY